MNNVGEPSRDDSATADEASPSEPAPVSLEVVAAETQATESSREGPGSSSGKSKPHQPSRTIHERLSRSRRRRASDHPFLAMPFEQYLEIVQWAADQLLAGQDQPPPPELASRLRDRKVDPGRWYAAVDQFQEWLHGVVGSSAGLASILARSGRRWRQGVRHCRDVFT